MAAILINYNNKLDVKLFNSFIEAKKQLGIEYMLLSEGSNALWGYKENIISTPNGKVDMGEKAYVKEDIEGDIDIQWCIFNLLDV